MKFDVICYHVILSTFSVRLSLPLLAGTLHEKDNPTLEISVICIICYESTRLCLGGDENKL